MVVPTAKKGVSAGLFATICLISLAFLALADAFSADHATLNVLVKDAESGQPISQAHLTLVFSERRIVGPDKVISYSAKTNAQGKYRFQRISKGTIHLVVTAEKHQTFGKDYEFDKDNQLIEVKLKKPQPLL